MRPLPTREPGLEEEQSAEGALPRSGLGRADARSEPPPSAAGPQGPDALPVPVSAGPEGPSARAPVSTTSPGALPGSPSRPQKGSPSAGGRRGEKPAAARVAPSRTLTSARRSLYPHPLIGSLQLGRPRPAPGCTVLGSRKLSVSRTDVRPARGWTQPWHPGARALTLH